MNEKGFRGIMIRLLLFFILSLIVIEHIYESKLWIIFFIVLLITFIFSTLIAFKNLNR